MNKFSIIMVLIVLALFSCDSRTSARENLENAISDFSNKQKTLETVTYYPERYTEIKTDSIIANTFKVQIKNYSLMNSEILISEQMTTKNFSYHRKFAADISVEVRSKEILSMTLASDQFVNPLESEFWSDATLEHVWVNQEQSSSEELNLGITFINPKENSHKYYELILDQNGNRRLNLIEEHS